MHEGRLVALWRRLVAKREIIELIAVIVVVLLACNASKSGSDTSKSASSAEPKVDLGPCADLTIGSVKDAFDQAKVNKCAECCEDKAPNAKRAYYHFEGNAPPGRCRCVVASPKPGTSGKNPDCSDAKDMGACLSCCVELGKGAEFKKGKGCTCQ